MLFLVGAAALFSLSLAFSALLLHRAVAAERAHQMTTDAMQAQFQLELFRAGRRDALTNLSTRPVFIEKLSATLARSSQLAVFRIDLDGFAAINDTFGETTGDEVLRVLADRLRSLAGTREHAARLDGDGFALLTDRTEDLDNPAATAERILHALTVPYPAGGELIEIGACIGVASSPRHGSTADGLLSAARQALRRAKEAGCNSWRLCGQELQGDKQDRARFRQELKAAIAAGQIIPWYQPIVRLPSGTIAKFEVLARWTHPELGILMADRFISLADELGLSGQISMALLRQVANDCRAWPEDCRFAFNVSAGQVRELIGLLNAQPGDWQRRMDFSRLDVEITEAALLHDRDMARELIDTLHEHGARAGLDNFGTGISNFSFLRDMPFDSIKIGKMFIQTIAQNHRAEACVLAMLWLGHGLNVEMVADGVETAETAERLADMKCDFAQGFFYARPMPAEDVLPLISRKERLGELRADDERAGPAACVVGPPASPTLEHHRFKGDQRPIKMLVSTTC